MKTVSRGRIVAFALLLLVALVAGFYTSGGKFGGLGSSYLNNPNFVCTQASLMSGEVQYNQSTADIERLMVEKTALEKQAQSGKADISKQEAQVRRGEAQKKSADNTVKTLDNYIDKNCSASALKSLQNPRNNTRFTERQKICDQKKKELRDAKQDARKLQTQITQQKSALATLNSTITKAQADIISLGKKIKSAQDFKEDYETCKRSFAEKPIISGEVSIANFDLIVSGEVFVNQPFDMTVKALDASGKIIKDYQGTIYFDEDSPKLCDILGTCPILKILFPNNGKYTFTSADNGVHNFAKGISINRADVYNLIVFELNGPNGGIHKTVQVVVKEKISPVATCGNGIKEGPEQCDDGNTNINDSCDNKCKNTGPIISGEATPPTKLDKINRYGATVLAVLTKGIEYKNYTCTGRFSDIGKAYPACAFVESAAAAGLTNSANSTFRPRDNLTRYEALVFALRAAGLIPSGFQTQSGLIQLGVDNGLITSVADFNVHTPATYGDFLHYLSEAMIGKTWNDFFSTETGITSIFN